MSYIGQFKADLPAVDTSISLHCNVSYEVIDSTAQQLQREVC